MMIAAREPGILSVIFGQTTKIASAKSPTKRALTFTVEIFLA